MSDLRHALLSLAFGAALAVAPGALSAQTPPAAPAPAQAAPATPAPGAAPAEAPDAFGEELALPERNFVFLKGTATWDTAFETLVDAFKSVNEYLGKEGIKPSGLPMTVYISPDDTGFQFQAGYPITETPKNPPQGDMTVGKTPSGRALKFVHRGSYDSMETTYEAITNYLEEKKLEPREVYLEEYVTDPLTTADDKLVVNVIVPVK